ncbi:MAG: hypothetical protein ACTSQI_00885 [Candidatus Helarchaeota archaeon]
MGLFETIIGVILGIIAGLMFSYGAVLQKKAVDKMPDIKLSDYKTITPLLKNRTWVIGVVVGTMGGIPYILSQLYIGLGYTQLLIATGLILLAYMASKMLHEPLGLVEYAGIGLILLGSIFLGLANLQPVDIAVSDPNFLRNALIFYIPFFSIILLGMLVYKLTDRGAAKNLGAISGIIFGCGAGFSQMGILAFAEGYILFLFIAYIILAIGTILGTVVANIAFQKGKAVVVIPIQSAGNYLIPVLAGLTIFNQTFLNPDYFWTFFVPAIVLIMVGVFFLARIQAEMEQSPEGDNKGLDASSSPP